MEKDKERKKKRIHNAITISSNQPIIHPTNHPSNYPPNHPPNNHLTIQSIIHPANHPANYPPNHPTIHNQLTTHPRPHYGDAAALTTSQIVFHIVTKGLYCLTVCRRRSGYRKREYRYPNYADSSVRPGESSMMTRRYADEQNWRGPYNFFFSGDN